MNPGPPYKSGPSSGRSASLLLIGAGIVVFIVCSIAQAAGGSSMFTTSFKDPDNPVLGLLVQVTWWPGWILTVALIGRGILGLRVR